MKYTGNSEKIIDMIKHIMIDKRIKQNDIARITGQTKPTISNFLNYRNPNPTLDTLKMYCDAIDCDLIIDIVPKD